MNNFSQGIDGKNKKIHSFSEDFSNDIDFGKSTFQFYKKKETQKITNSTRFSIDSRKKSRFSRTATTIFPNFIKK